MTATAFAPEARAHRAWQAGQALMKRGLVQEAAGRLEQASRIRPRDKLYKLTLAQALLKLEKEEPALGVLEEALNQDWSDDSVLDAFLQCLKLLHRDEKLVATLQRLPDARMTRDRYLVLGEALARIGRHVEAVKNWLNALSLDITDATMHLRLGYAFYDMGMQREATECLQTALALGLGENEGAVYDLLAMYARQACEWELAGQQIRSLQSALEKLPDDACVQMSPFCHAVFLEDPVLMLKAARSQSRFLQRHLRPLPPRKLERRDRIRVGYLSSDCHYHATAMLMAQLLESHDRSRFQVHLYSYGPDDGSELRKRLQRGVEYFVDLRQSTVPEMVRRIREDGVDILVDLKGYTRDARPLVTAARPAPVQVSYLGYPGTLGADYIDYIIGDPWVTPLESAAAYSEKIANVAQCYQCNDGTRRVPVAPSRKSVGLPDDALVLCNFNQLYKVSSEVFDVWCRILRQLPQAVLWMLRTSDHGARVLSREAQARGISPDRLIFAKDAPIETHLDRLACADLALDCWPCNGHTTTSDALWAGVPVVTFSGRTFASRVAGSLLKAVDASPLVTTTVEDYEQLVVELARHPHRIQQWRSHMEGQRTRASLFDARPITRQIESLYEQMWERALAGLKPDHLHSPGT